ncbi:MAG: site-specific integrase [Actinomycetota bacterium]|nr:site-specific integrase [Actinomycetota bacterium]
MSLDLAQRPAITPVAAARARWAPLDQFPPRPVLVSWPTTELDRVEALQHMMNAGRRPFAPDSAGEQGRRRLMSGLLLDWLADKAGTTWQQRWLVDETDVTGLGFRRVLGEWLSSRGYPCRWQLDYLSVAVRMAISADVLRPSLSWLISGAMGRGALFRVLAATRDPDGFARLHTHAAADPEIGEPAVDRMSYRASLIMAAKGGALDDVTVGDVVELYEAESAAHGKPGAGTGQFYRTLQQLHILGQKAPASLRQLRTAGQRTPEQLIDRYNIACRPVRDLLVDYLKERQTALDYNSLESLAYLLGNLFWADLEAHHPGISSLHLPDDVARDWKLRLQTTTKTVPDDAGGSRTIVVPRLSYRECLTPVRALYLDLAHWAVEDPARWAAWVAPCPIGQDEGVLRKVTRQRKARMDARTRQRLPALPALMAALTRHRHDAQTLLDAAHATPPGADFVADGTVFTRHHRTDGVWAQDATGRRRNLTVEEQLAFWVWAIVEVLRATGVRIEELLELTHHSLVQYRLPTTGELIPLLQIAPSKTDKERLLVVSPELADILAQIINRVRGPNATIALVSGYDDYERVWLPAAPRLFQRRVNGENHVFAHSSVLKMLNAAVIKAGLADPVDGHPLRFTPHDFRRMFITDAILNGLPPHIAQVIAGHQDVNVTLGYKAVYPEEAIHAHLAFLARRRALRPSDEYRVPTDEEWTEFLGHWERRKVSIGTCARAFATPCIHEHACVRCSMLWPDPDQQARLLEIRDNLHARIAEANRESWLGEIEGLHVSLAGAEDKLAQIMRLTTVNLGVPAVAATPRPTSPR